MGLADTLRDILGTISNYKSKYEHVKQERDELKSELDEANKVAQQIKEELEKWKV